MPTYQYVCTACAEGLEVQQSFTDDALTVCPACEGRLRKVFNAVGVVFKGSGFYRTDSREKSTSSESSSNGSSSKDSSSESTGSSTNGSSSSSSSDTSSSTSSSSGSSDSSSSSKASTPA